MAINNIELSKSTMANVINRLKELDATAKIGEIKTVGALDTVSVTITVGEHSQTVTISVPVLDNPNQASIEQVDNEVLEEKINGIIQDLTSADAASSTGSVSNGIYFDLYAILSLVLKAAQQLRKTAAEQRASEHKELEASMQQQAETLKTTAASQYSRALLSAGLQTCGLVLSTAMSAASVYRQSKSFSSSDISNASKNLNAVTLDTKKLTGASEVTQFKKLETVEDFKSALTTKNLTLADNQNDASQGVAVVKENKVLPEKIFGKTVFLKDQKTFAVSDPANDADATFKDMTGLPKTKAAIEAYQTGNFDQKVETAKVKFEAAEQKLTNLAGNENAPNYEQVKGEYMQAKEEYAAAKVAKGEALLAIRQGLQDDVKSLNALGTPEAKMKAQQLQAWQTLFEENYAQPMLGALEVKQQQVMAKYDQAMRIFTDGPDAKMGKRFEMFSQVTNQSFQTTDSFVRASSDRAEAEGRRQAKLSEKQDENIRARLETTKELTESAKETYQQILQMRRALEQSYHEFQQATLRA